MTIRKFEDFANSGELNSIYIGGTDASIHKVMTSGDIAISEDWIAVTSFSNSWVEYSVSYTVAYKKLKNNMVIVQGVVKNATSPTIPSTIFTLPVGYRPSQEYYITVPAKGTIDEQANIFVAPTGAVRVYSETAVGAAENFLPLGQISFLAEA